MKKPYPSVVFCTTCKNRTFHLESILAKNIADNCRPNTKFVVLDYNSQDHLSGYIKKTHKRDLDSGKLSYFKYYGNHPFRMAHAKNMAHRLGILEGADILVNLDADNITGKGFDQYIADQFASHESEVFLWANMIKGVLPKGISGRIVVSKDQFLNVGGYDEKYETYSPDDKDFKARLTRLDYVPLEIDVKFLDAIRHTDKMRFREYPQAANADAEDFGIDPHNRVVNHGRVGCGTVFKNFDLDNAIEIKPIPTRIFGIGAHKTATTSLHHALEVLGYVSGHWKNAHWAKSIWTQMRLEGRSKTLEKCYAVSDLPIPVLFRELDHAYRGSKFILTTRQESDWINSVRKHWNPEYNKQQPYWKKDPFTSIIHRVVYGQIQFDAELFLSKYRKHNADVLEYFKDRPDDLLVMDMTRKDKWEMLCGFLGNPIPDCDYPDSNVSPSVSQTESDWIDVADLVDLALGDGVR